MDTINIQSNILHNTTTINDVKGYTCDLSIFTSDSDKVRIHNYRSNIGKQSEQAVVRENITGKVIKERNVKENVPSNRKGEYKKGQSKTDTRMYNGKIDSCYHSIQQEHESNELKWACERDTAESKKKCEEQRRESFVFS